MKLSQLTDKNFQVAVKSLMSKPLPIKTAYKLKGVVNTVNDELAKYESLRKELIDRLSNKKEDGSIETDNSGNVLFSNENRMEYFKELRELLDMDVEVPTIKLSDLGEINVTTDEIFSLGDLISG